MRSKIKFIEIVVSVVILAVYVSLNIFSYLEIGDFCVGIGARIYYAETFCFQNEPEAFGIISFLWIGLCIYIFINGLGLDSSHEDKYWGRGKDNDRE